MYKVRNPYKSHIMDLNLMSAHEYKKSRITLAEVSLTLLPLLFIGIFAVVSMVPDLAFFAECQNIPGGDICTISLK